ncbi:MAG: transglycosylase SLT domain-containing protein [Candidatus Coatesbacteria bacterium]|nr:transglycosylase SLT domain-containing protein [Candidatus Coatesbacteria bacterium]
MLGKVSLRRLAAGITAVLLSCVLAPPAVHASGTLLRLADALEAWGTAARAEKLAGLLRQEKYDALLEELDQLATLFPRAYRDYRLDYLKAEALGRMGAHAEAARLLIALERSSAGELGKQALCDAISWAAKSGHWEEAEAAARTLGEKYCPDNTVKGAAACLAQSLYSAGRYDAALCHFERLEAVFPSCKGGNSSFMIARCLEELGKIDEACERYLGFLMRDKPDDNSASSLERLLALESHLRAKNRAGPAFWLAAADVCLWNHKYAEGLRHLSNISPKSPRQVLKKAGRTKAMCLFKQRNYAKAAKQFERLRRGYKEPGDIAWAEMNIGHCCSRLGQADSAIQHYRAASVGAPSRDMRARAGYLVGRELETAGRGEQAQAAYEAVIKQFPDESSAAHARWRIALATLVANDVESAEKALQGLIALHDKTLYYCDACYFMARLRSSQGNYKEAAERYAANYGEFPDVYFGHVSLDRLSQLRAEGKVEASTLTKLADEALRSAEECLGTPNNRGYLVMLRKAQALSGEDSAAWQKAAELRDEFLKAQELTAGFLAPDSNPLWAFRPQPRHGRETTAEVAAFFISLGMDDKGARLLGSLSLAKPEDLDTLYATVRMFERLGKQGETILLAERAFRRLDTFALAVSDVPKWFAEALYPKGFSSYVEEYCGIHHVDPAIVYALIREESRFQASSLSSAGARGVMQLIVPTALQVAKLLGLADMPLQELYEPKTNIALGIKYLSQLLSRFDGRTVFALASYNGGPNNVERWLNTCPGEVDDEGFINAITFSETRRYAQKVLASYRIYKWLYSSDAQNEQNAQDAQSMAEQSTATPATPG